MRKKLVMVNWCHFFYQPLLITHSQTNVRVCTKEFTTIGFGHLFSWHIIRQCDIGYEYGGLPTIRRSTYHKNVS